MSPITNESASSKSFALRLPQISIETPVRCRLTKDVAMTIRVDTQTVMAIGSKSLMFRASDDLVLESLAEVVEIVAVACDADDEIAMLLRV